MKNIIHVDNSEFFRKQMRVFLEEEGFEVEGLDSAQEANLTIGAGSADMVIMGLTFTDIDGKDFAKKIVETFTGPVIVVSSSLTAEKVKELNALGIVASFDKSGPWKDGVRPHLLALNKE
jgi:two-component system cell cycle response regulator